MFIRHRRWENFPLTTHNSTANVRQPLTIFFSDMEPLSHYSPVLLHLSPGARILTENPEVACSVFVARFSVALSLKCQSPKNWFAILFPWQIQNKINLREVL